MKIYLAGPMRGIPEFNREAFGQAAEKLRAQGHTVFVPHEADALYYGKDITEGSRNGDEEELAKEHGFSLREATARSLTFICREADAVALLPGWEESKGARVEWALAVSLDLQFIYL